MQESFLNSPLIYSIALTLIHFLWQGVLVALALKLLLIFTSDKRSQLRYAYSVLAMILNLVLPIITFFIIYKPGYLQLTEQLSQSSITGLEFTQIISKQDEWYSTIFEYLPYLTVAWLCIISILSLKLLVELYSVNQLPKRNTLAPETELFNRFKLLSHQIGLQKVPRLLLSLNTNVPMAIGWIKPVVLIPVSMLTGLTPTQLDMLMLHELAHIRRHDYLVNFIQSIIEIILFFHPCVLWVSNQIRNEREYCSDDIAVKNCGDPIAYAHTLADTASLCSKHRSHSIPSMAMAASGGDLTQRVLRLVDQHHCASSNQVGKWFASLTILSIILVALSQQLINLLEIELNSASYKPRIEIINSPPVLTNNEELLAAPLNSLISATEVQIVDPNSSKTQSVTIDNKLNGAIPTSPTIENNAEQLRVTSELTQKPKLIPQKAVSTVEAKLNTLATTTPKDFSSKKSISELAFEQTNSKLTSSLNNPYAKQITELSDETNLSDKKGSSQKLPIESVVEKNSYVDSPKTTPHVTSNVTQNAELIYSVPPRYPSTAKRKGIELEVKVDFTIDTNGNVKDIIFPTVKHKMNYFKTSIRLAIEKWRFIPAKSNGKEIDSKMSKIFSFSLHK